MSINDNKNIFLYQEQEYFCRKCNKIHSKYWNHKVSKIYKSHYNFRENISKAESFRMDFSNKWSKFSKSKEYLEHKI